MIVHLSNLLHGPTHWPTICCDSRNSVDTQRHAYLWCVLSCYSTHSFPLNSRTESFKNQFRSVSVRLFTILMCVSPPKNCVSIFGFLVGDDFSLQFRSDVREPFANVYSQKHRKSLLHMNIPANGFSFSIRHTRARTIARISFLVHIEIERIPFQCETPQVCVLYWSHRSRSRTHQMILTSEETVKLNCNANDEQKRKEIEHRRSARKSKNKKSFRQHRNIVDPLAKNPTPPLPLNTFLIITI